VKTQSHGLKQNHQLFGLCGVLKQHSCCAYLLSLLVLIETTINMSRKGQESGVVNDTKWLVIGGFLSSAPALDVRSVGTPAFVLIYQHQVFFGCQRQPKTVPLYTRNESSDQWCDIAFSLEKEINYDDCLKSKLTCCWRHNKATRQLLNALPKVIIKCI